MATLQDIINLGKIANANAQARAKALANSAPARQPAKAAPVRQPAKEVVYAPAKPVYKAPAKSTYSSGGGSSSGGGGYSSGGGGGGGGGGGIDYGGGGGFDGGGFSAAPAMMDVTVPDATEDTDYKRTVGDLARAFGDFDAQQKLSRNQYDFGFNEAKRRMGWSATDKKFDRTMPGAYGDAVYANENDFAGRGLTWSGLFGKASGDLNQDFADRAKGLDTARQDNVDTQGLARTTFQNNQDATKEAAKQNAISKIMAQFGIGQSEVPVGTGSRVIQRQVL